MALRRSGPLCIPWLTRAAARCSDAPVRRGFGEAQRSRGVPLDSPYSLELGPPQSLGGNEPVTFARCFIRTQLALQLATLGTPDAPWGMQPAFFQHSRAPRPPLSASWASGFQTPTCWFPGSVAVALDTGPDRSWGLRTSTALSRYVCGAQTPPPWVAPSPFPECPLFHAPPLNSASIPGPCVGTRSAPTAQIHTLSITLISLSVHHGGSWPDFLNQRVTTEQTKSSTLTWASQRDPLAVLLDDSSEFSSESSEMCLHLSLISQV